MLALPCPSPHNTLYYTHTHTLQAGRERGSQSQAAVARAAAALARPPSFLHPLLLLLLLLLHLPLLTSHKMSLGFLTESALLPSKAKPIQVDGRSQYCK